MVTLSPTLTHLYLAGSLEGTVWGRKGDGRADPENDYDHPSHVHSCTVHKTPSHTVIRLTHMNALQNKHYLLFMDKEAEAIER